MPPRRPDSLPPRAATSDEESRTVEQFVSRGMVADLNVHWPVDAHGEAKPHAHVMLTMREVGPEGFGRKVSGVESRSGIAGLA